MGEICPLRPTEENNSLNQEKPMHLAKGDRKWSQGGEGFCSHDFYSTKVWRQGPRGWDGGISAVNSEVVRVTQLESDEA